MQAQSSVYFVVGIVIVAVLAVFFTMQSGVLKSTMVPYSIMQRENLVRESVEKIIRDGADISIEYLSMHGGYFDPPMDKSIMFQYVVVPYWQRCGERLTVSKNIIKARLENGTKNHILNSLAGNFPERVKFNMSMLDVSANILDDRIDFTVTLPMTIDGYFMDEPYRVSVPSKFGRIIDFANEFIDENIDERWFEEFTKAAIEMSSSELLRQGVITECGKCERLSADEISGLMENVAEFVRINTFWWKPTHVSPDGSRVFSIESVDGKAYYDLNIRLLDPEIPMVTDKGVEICANDIVIDVGWDRMNWNECITFFDHGYSLYYPIVVGVEDALTNHNFYFAILVGLENLEPDSGECNLGVG